MQEVETAGRIRRDLFGIVSCRDAAKMRYPRVIDGAITRGMRPNFEASLLLPLIVPLVSCTVMLAACLRSAETMLFTDTLSRIESMVQEKNYLNCEPRVVQMRVPTWVGTYLRYLTHGLRGGFRMWCRPAMAMARCTQSPANYPRIP